MNTANSVAKLAEAQYPEYLSGRIKEFRTLKISTSEQLLKMLKLGREIGIGFKEWRGHEQMKFEFWASFARDNLSKLTEVTTIEDAERFIRIANRYPDDIEHFDGIAATVQMLLVDTPAQRTEPQRASPVTPLTHFMNTIGTARERFEKWIEDEPLDAWPESRIELLRPELKWAHDLYEKLEK